MSTPLTSQDSWAHSSRGASRKLKQQQAKLRGLWLVLSVAMG